MVMHARQQEADINFQGKHSMEKFQFYFYQHWIRLGWPLLKLVGRDALIISIFVITLISIGVADDFNRRIALAIFSLIFILSHMEFLKRVYCYFLRVTIVTDRRVHRIHKSLLFIDDHQSVDLWMLQDVYRKQHSLFENILGYGIIVLDAQDTHIQLYYVPRIITIGERIMALREQARDHTTPYSAVKRSENFRQDRLERQEKKVRRRGMVAVKQ